MKPFTFAFLVVLGMVLAHRVRECPGHSPGPRAPRATRVLAQSVPSTGVDLDEPNERAPAEGLPVPIYPGTRVTEAQIQPPRTSPPSLEGMPSGTLIGTHLTAEQGKAGSRTVSGQLCGTEPRARDNARMHLEREVTEWLAPDVPAEWKPPAYLIDRLIARVQIEPVVRDYGTLYEATLDVNLTPGHRAEIVGTYHHELVRRRMTTLGGGLGFILACLAALSGYIRADEATKGYYTQWLRAIAAAGVGASGVLLYQLLA